MKGTEKKNELQPKPHASHTKIHSKWIIALNVKHKTIKLLEKSVRGNLCGQVVDREVLNMALKA